MAQTLDIAGAGTVGMAGTAPRSACSNLERPGDVFRGLGPNWFASDAFGGWLMPARCHADVLRGASVFLFGLLPVAWLVVASRTVSGVATGRLFAPAISRALSV